MNLDLDRKAIVVITICVLAMVFYSPIMKLVGLGRFVVAPRRPAVVDTSGRAGAPPLAANGPTMPPAPGRDTTTPRMPAATQLTPSMFRPVAAEIEKTFDVETPLYRAHFSTRGARLVSVELKRYASAHGISSQGGKIRVWRHGEEIPSGDRVTLAGGPLVALDLGSGTALQSLGDVNFSAQESTDAAGDVRALTFTHRDSSGMFVRETWRVRPDSYALDLETELRNVPPAWRVSDYAITLRSWPLMSEGDPLSDARALRASSLVGTNLHKDHAGGLVRGPKSFDGNVQWAAVQNRYFMNGVAITHATGKNVMEGAVRRDLTPEELSLLPPNTRGQQEIVINQLVLSLPSELAPVQHFIVYTGPCEYFQLARLHAGLERAVDMGWSWLLPFSKALLWLLTRIFDVVRNYGVAIIVLATLVRVVLHPLNVSSMKSMRAMQRLQPEMDRIKEKYKNDPQAMNTAMMALYKENKVNPAGGCLPLFIQMPMFIALYNVLFNAIQLRQAPFVGWMHDLSAPDLLFMVAGFPIRLLPILMAGSGFLQQMVTPTAPEQRPTMYMMNAFMLVFFYNLPSGLVLYWTVMNLLTAAQQYLVMRQDVPVVMGTPVPAAVGSGRKKRG